MSKLYDFCTVATAPFDLFMCYVANKPVGNTRKLPKAAKQGEIPLLNPTTHCLYAGQQPSKQFLPFHPKGNTSKENIRPSKLGEN